MRSPFSWATRSPASVPPPAVRWAPSAKPSTPPLSVRSSKTPTAMCVRAPRKRSIRCPAASTAPSNAVDEPRARRERALAELQELTDEGALDFDRLDELDH